MHETGTIRERLTSDVVVAGTTYRICALERDGAWTAWAERVDTEQRFGATVNGRSRHAAIEQMAGWLAWQDEHHRALEALQQVEHTYHRAVVASAFGAAEEDRAAGELKKEQLAAMDAARARLDEIRARQPSTGAL